MKITQADSNKTPLSVTPGGVSNEVIFDDLEVNEEIPETGEILNFTTQSGRSAIRFVSKITGLIIEILKPTAKDYLDIERHIRKVNPNAGEFEQIMYNISFLVCRYGELRGEKCLSFDRLTKFQDLNQILEINLAMQESFRIGQIG